LLLASLIVSIVVKIFAGARSAERMRTTLASKRTVKAAGTARQAIGVFSNAGVFAVDL